MSEDKEILMKINKFTAEIIKEILSDKGAVSERNLKNAVEYLSRSVIDLTSLVENKNDRESTLKATLSKVKISYNSILQKVEKSYS